MEEKAYKKISKLSVDGPSTRIASLAAQAMDREAQKKATNKRRIERDQREVLYNLRATQKRAEATPKDTM